MTTDLNEFTQRFSLQPDNPQHLANLCGNLDSHLMQIAQHFNLTFYHRGNQFQMSDSKHDTLTFA